MNKTSAVSFVYVFFVACFVFLILFLKTDERTSKQNRDFVAVTTMSDSAFYTKVYGIRFYSLVTFEDIVDDPVLPPHTLGDFVYKVHK